MRKYLVLRFLQFLAIVFIANSLTFIVPRLVPGDPIVEYLNNQQLLNPNPEFEKWVEEYKEKFGVNEPLWRVVQAHPSAAVFPGGEGLAQVQARAVAAIREHDRRLSEQHGGDALWVACTHGDVIKSLIADAYGMHLDSFQRVNADPASVSVIRYTPLRPFVLHVNHTGSRLSAAVRAAPPPKAEPTADPSAEPAAGSPNQPAGALPSSDAVVGGSRD